MIIRQLTLTDYGPYGGEHTFELDTIPGKPVILVGGRNGGGKTTWFESIPLCLYGYQSGKHGRKSYEERLRRLIHRSGNGRMEISERRTSIQVKFQISSGGKLAEYMVRRSWRAYKDGVSEELDVKRKTTNEYESLDSIEQDQWQSFVTGLIPPGIADLFFFDGEKVAQMAEGGRENSAIRIAFNSLLGLDTVERLRTDLRTNLVRNLTGDDTHIREEVERLEAEKAEIEQTATRTKDTRTRKISELTRVRSQIQTIEDKLESLGGGYAKKRQDIRERLASKEAVADMLSKRIGMLCAAEMPFGMMPIQLDEGQGADEGRCGRGAVRRRSPHYRRGAARHTGGGNSICPAARYVQCHNERRTGSCTPARRRDRGVRVLYDTARKTVRHNGEVLGVGAGRSRRGIRAVYRNKPGDLPTKNDAGQRPRRR